MCESQGIIDKETFCPSNSAWTELKQMLWQYAPTQDFHPNSMQVSTIVLSRTCTQVSMLRLQPQPLTLDTHKGLFNCPLCEAQAALPRLLCLSTSAAYSLLPRVWLAHGSQQLKCIKGKLPKSLFLFSIPLSACKWVSTVDATSVVDPSSIQNMAPLNYLPTRASNYAYKIWIFF